MIRIAVNCVCSLSPWGEGWGEGDAESRMDSAPAQLSQRAPVPPHPSPLPIGEREQFRASVRVSPPLVALRLRGLLPGSFEWSEQVAGLQFLGKQDHLLARAAELLDVLVLHAAEL